MLATVLDTFNTFYHSILRVISILKRIIFHFAMKILRFREVEWFAQDYHIKDATKLCNEDLRGNLSFRRPFWCCMEDGSECNRSEPRRQVWARGVIPTREDWHSDRVVVIIRGDRLKTYLWCKIEGYCNGLYVGGWVGVARKYKREHRSERR